MAEPLVHDHWPSVRVESRQGRSRSLQLLTRSVLAAALMLFVVILWPRWSAFPAGLIGIVVPVSRWRWARRPGPGELRGDLLIPKARWWQDRRAVLTLDNDHVRIRRAFEPEVWNVPWASIDEVLVEEGRPCRLSLLLDGTPLAEMDVAIDSGSLVARLNAHGLPEDSGRP